MSAGARRRGLRLGACVLISLALAGLTGLLAEVERLGRFEGVASDLAFPRGELDPSIAVVRIDAKALAEVDPSWPWPRQKHAALIRALNDAGARVIVFDIAFVSPADGDAELAAAMHDAGNVVLATTTLDLAPGQAPRSSSGLLRSSVVEPIQPLADEALAIGHTQVIRDKTDGAVRMLPLVVEDTERRVIPALSLVALGAASGDQADPIIRRPTGVQVAGRAIPTNRDHALRISYTPELTNTNKTAAVVSAADVLNGQVDPETLRDKVVYVGVTDVSLGDRMQTPVAKGSGLPGVLVQASAFDTMISRTYVAAASTLETVLWVFLVALVITLSVQFLPTWAATLAAVGMLVVYLLTAYLRADTGTLMNFTYPTLAVALAVPLSLAVRYFVEVRQRRRVSALFETYLPRSVAVQLIDEGRVDDVTEGERVDVTVMFCDLRGFTERSANLEPVQVNAMLSHFYEYASSIVLGHHGTLMMYIGDEIFAIFGAPVIRSDHAACAVECARELQERIEQLDKTLDDNGFASLRFGIGLNAGDVVAAHVGSTWRRQYTAIGDTVNVGSRLCSQAGPGQVVLSESVRTQVERPLKVERLDGRSMKGVRADFTMWKLVLDRPPSGTHDR
jgi:adenylate cyclase